MICLPSAYCLKAAGQAALHGRKPGAVMNTPERAFADCCFVGVRLWPMRAAHGVRDRCRRPRIDLLERTALDRLRAVLASRCATVMMVLSERRNMARRRG